ncbi:MAG: ATP-binding cassette domain-containing protein [Melioribacteraceae bacterium]|nr:ATP-binding cassette domain-containing protein [Melioribacteraceae bacterium]
MKVILKVDSIFKRFGKINAVNNLSFNVEKGEIFSLLGPNGAGKTTTVRMLLNIIKPDYGTIEYFFDNSAASRLPSASQLGYLPEDRGLYQEIPIIRTLEYMGVIRGMNKVDARKASEMWLSKLDLLDRKNEKLSALSKGNQQKIQFISSVLHNPSFAILDEPFTGFDPINQEIFLMIIKELSEKGTTILLSAHQMHLVEKIADKVLLINNGKSIASGTIEELKKENIASEKLILKFEGNPDFNFFQNDVAVERIEKISDGEIKILLKQNKSLSELLIKASSIFKINSITTEHITLHDIFIEKVKQDKEKENES